MDGGRFSLVWALFLLCITAKVAEGGECCDAHYDVATRKVINDRWCDDYCCLSGTQYICCSNPSLRAPSSERSIFCGNWFTQYMWIPIVVGVSILGLIVFCVVCCCCSCCSCLLCR